MNTQEIKIAVNRIKEGGVVILTDHRERENEGDFVQAAQDVSPESINFMISFGKGLVCQCITEDKARSLQLEDQISENTSLHATAFTVSVDAKRCTTTGISAYDRALTIQTIAADSTKPEDLAKPGHIFPIVSHKNGLLSREGHTEGSVYLTELAGKRPSAVICEILNEKGMAATQAELIELSKKFDIPIVSIDTLILHKKGLL